MEDSSQVGALDWTGEHMVQQPKHQWGLNRYVSSQVSWLLVLLSRTPNVFWFNSTLSIAHLSFLNLSAHLEMKYFPASCLILKPLQVKYVTPYMHCVVRSGTREFSISYWPAASRLTEEKHQHWQLKSMRKHVYT